MVTPCAASPSKMAFAKSLHVVRWMNMQNVTYH